MAKKALTKVRKGKAVIGAPTAQPGYKKLNILFREFIEGTDISTGHSRLKMLFEALYEKASNPDNPQSVQAANVILERSYGKQPSNDNDLVSMLMSQYGDDQPFLTALAETLEQRRIERLQGEVTDDADYEILDVTDTEKEGSKQGKVESDSNEK